MKLIENSRQKSMNLEMTIMEAERSFRELDSENMQATLIQIEDFFDTNNLYVYKNWFNGELWDGPDIKRHWVELTLMYPYNDMPDPKGAKRLVNAGAKIRFEESKGVFPVDHARAKDEIDNITRKPKEEERPVWLVHFKIPKNLIQDAQINVIPDDNEQDVNKSSEEPTTDSKNESDLENDINIEDEVKEQ